MEGDCQGRLKEGKRLTERKSVTRDEGRKEADVYKRQGLNTNASLDGRRAGEAISDNLGPVHTDGGSHDTEGPTAVSYTHLA